MVRNMPALDWFLGTAALASLIGGLLLSCQWNPSSRCVHSESAAGFARNDAAFARRAPLDRELCSDRESRLRKSWRMREASN